MKRTDRRVRRLHLEVNAAVTVDPGANVSTLEVSLTDDSEAEDEVGPRMLRIGHNFVLFS